MVAQRPDMEVPYEGIDDFVSTLRNSCSPTGVFKWPCKSLNFQKAVAVALHHCPPGRMVVIKNAVATPASLKDPFKKAKELEMKTTEWQAEWKETADWSQSWWQKSSGAGDREAGQWSDSASSWKPSEKYPGQNWHGENEIRDTNEYQWASAEGDGREDVVSEASVWFHGTHAHTVPKILEKGFRPCMDAGADARTQRYAQTSHLPL